MLEKLKTLPADKMPPCVIYSELVAATGLRNGWTCKQWIDYLKKGF